METPVFDFVRRYAQSGTVRLHMPGHKGRGPLGCEALDITEIKGADSLYEADGILAQSEQNAAALFGSGRSFYSAGGSSQCVKAMLFLAMQMTGRGTVFAARNVHRSFVHAAALLDLDVRWLWPEDGYQLLRCPVSPQSLCRALEQTDVLPAAVYLTSPDYLGHLQPIRQLAQVCHQFGVLLLVDNAHGAYLHFLEKPCHPLDLGADLCCDSAHKTLPVLTGGAYLHLASSVSAPDDMVRQALAIFGSTSPSYLILQSLDLCNQYLDTSFRRELAQTVERIAALRSTLSARGWVLPETEPMKLVLHSSASGIPGTALADLLRKNGIECEFADPDYLVLMPTPQNSEADFIRLAAALSEPAAPKGTQVVPALFSVAPPVQAMCIREALFSSAEKLPIAQAVGRFCAAPAVSCPPAVPIAVSGEVIGEDLAEVFSYYGIDTLPVVREKS